MSHRVPCARLAPLALAAALSCSVHASESLREMVVTATRSPTPVDELLSEVLVITAGQIEAAGARTLPELLVRTAGVQMAANGGLGKNASVFIRGAESRHVLLLIDGVRYGSATTGAPVWDNLPLDLIERIEVLKGPASALYGSDAVGGVVQIFTRRGRGPLTPAVSAGVGSHGRLQASASLGAGDRDLSWSVGAQTLRESGFSATNATVPFGNHNPDRDGFRQHAANASVAVGLGGSWRADAAAFVSRGTTHYDDGPGRDTQARLRSRVVQAGIAGEPLAGWRTELRIAESEDVSDNVVAAFPGRFETTQRQWSWQNQIGTPLGLLTAGAEWRRQQVDSTTRYAVTQRGIDGVYAGLHGQVGPHGWQLNLRRDRNSQFGGASTFFAAYGLRLAPGWRAQLSHGTSFVAPSFNQLYFPNFGNPALQPERGRSSEAGIVWSGGGHELRLIRFDNRIRGFISSGAQPANIPRARIDGWTLAWSGRSGPWTFDASLDSLNPRNQVTGRLLPRRAREQITLGLSHRAGGWTLGAQLLHLGDRFDDAANQNRLAGYTTLDLTARWAIDRQWTLDARVDNLFDRRYETARGYNQPGRQLLVTLRWRPQ